MDCQEAATMRRDTALHVVLQDPSQARGAVAVDPRIAAWVCKFLEAPVWHRRVYTR